MKRLFLVLALAAAPAFAANLKWAAQNDILTLDPHSQNHATSNSILQHAYEGLTRYARRPAASTRSSRHSRRAGSSSPTRSGAST